MARIAGVELPRDKHIEIGLTYVFGIGLSTSQKLLKIAQLDPSTKVAELTEAEVSRLRDTVSRELPGRVEGDLRRQVALNIKRLMEIGTYRGLRHRRGLPVRGQRTRTNARARRGPRKTVGVRRKKARK